MTRINLTTFEHESAVRGKTVSEMARIAGLSSSTLAKIRRGDEVSVKTIDKLGAALRRTPASAGAFLVAS